MLVEPVWQNCVSKHACESNVPVWTKFPQGTIYILYAILGHKYQNHSNRFTYSEWNQNLQQKFIWLQSIKGGNELHACINQNHSAALLVQPTWSWTSHHGHPVPCLPLIPITSNPVKPSCLSLSKKSQQCCLKELQLRSSSWTSPKHLTRWTIACWRTSLISMASKEVKTDTCTLHS